MPAMKSSEWASLANEIGGTFEGEGTEQMSMDAAMRLLEDGKRSMQALMSQVESAITAAEEAKQQNLQLVMSKVDMAVASAEEAKKKASVPPAAMPKFDVSSVAEAVRANQVNFDALIKAVQNLKLQVNQAAPNITMPKIDIPTPVVNVEMPRPKGWRFEFVRGKDGLVESIRATPE
jgi:hypothetical protein